MRTERYQGSEPFCACPFLYSPFSARFSSSSSCTVAQLLRRDCYHNGLQGVNGLLAVVVFAAQEAEGRSAVHPVRGMPCMDILTPCISISIYSQLRYCPQLGLHSFRQLHLIEDPESVQDMFVAVEVGRLPRGSLQAVVARIPGSSSVNRHL
jgi:hypothetical protein